MTLELDKRTREFIRDHRVARLATVDDKGQPMVVPICYAFDGVHLYSALDEKPKSIAPTELKRVRNIRANSQVAVVIDEYSEDWSKLAYVLLSGQAEILDPIGLEHTRAVELLREKYLQYKSMSIEQRPIIKITLLKVKVWAPGWRGDHE